MVRRKNVPGDKSPSPLKTWGYSRVSTRQQADVGHSLEDQKVRIAAYATANNLPLPTEIFIDAATSGTVGLQRREAGKRLLDIAKRGDHIIVTKGDRLFRSAKNALEISELLRERGIALHCQDLGGEILNSPTSRLMFGMMMLFATIEAERIGERTTSVKETQTSLGFYTGISILPSRNTPMLHPRAGCSRVSNRRPSSPLHPRAVTRPGLESTGNGSVPPHFSDTSPR